MDLGWDKIRGLLKHTKELQQIGLANIIAKVIMGEWVEGVYMMWLLGAVELTCYPVHTVPRVIVH